jgi:hypothetical protein
MALGGRDPLGVRRSVRFAAEVSELVSIDRDALASYCGELAADGLLPVSEWDSEPHLAGEYELIIAYVFVLDAVNFCFWGDPKWRRLSQRGWLDGYWALVEALTVEATANPGFLAPDSLAELDAETLDRVLGGSPTIPLLEARAANLRELGRWVVGRFAGKFSNVLHETGLDAVELVRLLAGELDSFKDEAVYKGEVVRFYKRAQILASDLHGAFEGQGWGRLGRMRALTAFADYKLPQILRHRGVLRYSDPLAGRVDNEVPLDAGSSEEVEIRANTIWAVELMAQELQNLGLDAPAYRLDWLLWYASQDSGHMKPYHRTRTIYY